MIDAAHPLASGFLWIAGGVFLVLFALPLALAPMRWAAVFQWKLPADTDLAVYLGRCLGVVALALVVGCFRAAPAPAEHLFLFDVLIAACGLLTVVHVVGALEKRQPWTETVEIGLYAAVTAALIWIRLDLG